MFKANKLMKVVSILMIIFGALGAVSVIGLGMAVNGGGQMATIMESAGLSGSDLALSAVACIIEAAAGIIGVAVKNEKLVMGAVIVFWVITVISFAMTVINTGFVATSITSFILPVLYAWGWYQSK